MSTARPGDLVLFITPDRKRLLHRLEAGGQLHTHRGIVAHDDVIGRPFGLSIESHRGERFTVIRPSMEETLVTATRSTQIVFPKDIGYILLKLSVVPGARVIEAGTGSGALCSALARYVTPGGHVYSYDTRPEMQDIARGNVALLGVLDSVTFHERDIAEGFLETGVDALFLDVREPWRYLDHAVAALMDGGFLGAIVPTVNQVVQLAGGLEQTPFEDVEICELMLRQYKTTAERVRPLDRHTAHTGYLVFARKVAAVAARAAPAAGGEADDGMADEG